MTEQEINIANALLSAKEALTEIINNGLDNPKFIFALSNAISSKFNLTQDESIIVMENAIKLA